MTTHKGDTSARLMMARVCEDFPFFLKEIQFVLFDCYGDERRGILEGLREKVKISN